MKHPFLRARAKSSRLLRHVFNPPNVFADEFVRGANVIIEPGVTIRCRRLILGDGVHIRSGTQIEMDTLIIGDYTKINNNCLLTGTSPCIIGHNCWIGHFSIIDSIGTTFIGNGVGVGAHSQLWSHIYFGDQLLGCRFGSQNRLVIHDDAWLVGHCIVNPVTIHERGMAMTGSVVTKDIEGNQVYAGVPAKNATTRFGPQFVEKPIMKRVEEFVKLLNDFRESTGIHTKAIAAVDVIDPDDTKTSQFCVKTRQYSKHLTHEEVAFMRYVLPNKAKFIPTDDTDWIRVYRDEVEAEQHV